MDITVSANSDTGRTAGKKVRGRSLSGLKRFLPLYLMFLPVLLYYLIFCYGPMTGIVIAFKDYTIGGGILGSEWVGMDNFRRFLTNGDFGLVVGNTVAISALRLLFGFPAPVIFAIMLFELPFRRLKRIVQTAAYLPHFISWVVVYGILFNFFSSTGLVNQIITVLGHEPVGFLGNSGLFRTFYVGSAIWKETGWGAIIYIAALAGIDTQLYEAAIMDGAGRWQKLWHVTLPGIRGVIAVMFVLGLGNVLNVGFEQILVMYNSSVSGVAEVLDYYIYRIGLQQANNYSYATAVGLFRSALSLILVVLTNWGAKKIDEEAGLW